MATPYKMEYFKELSKQFSLLFVEDDDILRRTTNELMESLFEDTTVAVNGEDGLNRYEAYNDIKGKYFDIVITDIQMPKMDGVSLSREILKINKNQKILVVSAYDDKKYFIELINMGVSGFIQKPILSKHLFPILFKICQELDEERENKKFLKLNNDLVWNSTNKILLKNQIEINLTKNEKLAIELLISNLEQSFTNLEIFEYIYCDNQDKVFSKDAIKSMIKRIRRKTALIIDNTPELGYKLHLKN